MKAFIFTLLVCISCCCTAQSSQSPQSPLWVDLKAGSYDVGFKVNYLIDSTQQMMSSDSLPHAIEGKPIRVKVYYPGTKTSSSRQLLFSDQINIFPNNPQLATYNAILHKRDNRLQGQFSPASDSLEQVLFDTKTMAYLNIPHTEGKFPLIIYLLGLDDHQMENSVLWEYLASHGYVVAVLPSFGASLDRADVPANTEGALGLYHDAKYTMNAFVKESYIDSNLVGVVGHSFGGLVGILMASRHPNIRAVASLDGSINFERSQKVLEDLELNASSLQTPLLNLYAQGRRDLNFTFVESLQSPLYQVAYHKASHYDFQNFGLYAAVMNTTDERVERRRSAEEGKDILLSVIRLTKNFLDFTLRNNPRGETYIKGLSDEAQHIKVLGEFDFRTQ